MIFVSTEQLRKAHQVPSQDRFYRLHLVAQVVGKLGNVALRVWGLIGDIVGRGRCRFGYIPSTASEIKTLKIVEIT